MQFGDRVLPGAGWNSKHYTLNCNLLHVLAFWPSSGRFYNIHGEEYREEALDLVILFNVRCRKVHLMLDKRPKQEVDYN
jgi:hypothetical protein